jgi:hypothetical protein
MRIALATIALNEEEFVAAQLSQHCDWPGLEAWIWVEGACSLYADRNPEAVNAAGLSVDGTTGLLAAAEVNGYIHHLRFGIANDRSGALEPTMGAEKAKLRNAYCGMLDYLGDFDALIVIDADEFYTRSDQVEINRIVQASPAYDRFQFRQRHLWRPPSIAGSPRAALEVVGGYWSVPHLRVWRWRRGGRYTHDHNHVMFPGDTWPNSARTSLRHPGPQCVHLGFARDGEHRARTNAYYVHRGEGREQGFNRSMYTNCRASWEAWQPGSGLPHGARVEDYDGPVPAVWA